MTTLMIVPFWWHLASSMLDRQRYERGKCQTLTSWPVVMLLEKEVEQWLRRFCFFPSGDSVGHVNTLTGEKTERWEAAGVIGEVIFHTGESHFRLGLKNLGSREASWGARSSVPVLAQCGYVTPLCQSTELTPIYPGRYDEAGFSTPHV